jgi:hypothetical protein
MSGRRARRLAWALVGLIALALLGARGFRRAAVPSPGAPAAIAVVPSEDRVARRRALPAGGPAESVASTEGGGGQGLARVGRVTLLNDHADEVCRCRDRACVEEVRVRYAERAGEMVAEPGDVEAVRAIAERVRKCIAAL